MGLSRVLVVGGGIGGLATAAGLTRAGIACVVAERAPAWQPVGAGIVLGVNAMAVLRGLAAAEAVAASGQRLGRGAITDRRGRALGRTDFGALEAEFGPTVAIHRADLHTALLDAASDAELRLATSVEAIEQDEAGVDVRLTDGREERFDLLVGADGIRSRVRELSFGEVPVAYSGYTCWRLVVHVPGAPPEFCEMWGRGRRFGVVPVGRGRVYAFAVANAPRGRPDPAEGRLERFRDRFAEFEGEVPRVLAALRGPDDLIHDDLEEVPSAPWLDGRVALLGDAAHAMTPNMGQGAAMALEDSAVLVECLAGGGALSDALAGYRARREPRVRWVQNQSRRIGRVGQLEGALACRLRDSAMRVIPDAASTRALRRLARQPL